MTRYLDWLSMVPGPYDRTRATQGIHQAAAGIRADTAQAEQARANREREEQLRRAQTERERATAFGEKKSLFDVDVAAYNAQQKNIQDQSKAQVAWLKENQDRLRDPIRREAALAENAALFPVADQSLQRPAFGAPGGTDVVAAEAPGHQEERLGVEQAIAGQTGIEEGVLDDPQEGFGAPQDMDAPVSSTEEYDLDDFLGAVAGGVAGLQMTPPGMGMGAPPSQAAPPSAPAGPGMAPPGMGMQAQAYAPSQTEQDAAAAMQEAIAMGIMPGAPPANTTLITLANGEEMRVDFGAQDKASAAALQEVADAIAVGAPDVSRKAAAAIKTMHGALLKANGGNVEAANEQVLDVFLKLTDYEKSMRNAAAISRGKAEKTDIDFYKLGLSEMNRDHSDSSTFGKTRKIINDVYKGLQDVQSNNPMRKNAALKSMVTAIESRVSDKDMDFAPGDLSVIQRASKWFSTHVEGTMSDEMQHRLEGSLRAIYHDGMKKQATDYERVQQRIEDSYNMYERRGLMVAANKAFKGYERTKARPSGFFTKYRVTDRGPTPSGSKARGAEKTKVEYQTATADELIGDM